MENREETLLHIKEALTNDEFGQDAKLQAVRKLKEIFKPPDKVFSKIRLEPLLQSARFALENKTPEKNFLVNYGSSLVGFVGRDVSLDSELFYQLEYIMRELKKLDENQANLISAVLWSRLEAKSIIYSNSAVKVSQETIEKLVLDWVETIDEPRLEFPARMAAESPQLFQNFSAVLYQILVRTQGHIKVMKVINLFIGAVISVCIKEGKDFLGLYPKDCSQVVTFLMISPEKFSEKYEETVTQVNSLLSEMFLNDKMKALILLSHYSSWIGPFKQFLSSNNMYHCFSS